MIKRREIVAKPPGLWGLPTVLRPRGADRGEYNGQCSRVRQGPARMRQVPLHVGGGLRTAAEW